MALRYSAYSGHHLPLSHRAVAPAEPRKAPFSLCFAVVRAPPPSYSGRVSQACWIGESFFSKQNSSSPFKYVLFCFVLFALQLSVCLWWHDYRRDDFPTLKFGVVMADLLAIC